MDFGFLKDVFGNSVAIFFYGLVVGAWLALKLNKTYTKKDSLNCVFTQTKQKVITFQIYNTTTETKIFCENLMPKKRFLVFKTYHCKTLNEPCPYCTWH